MEKADNILKHIPLFLVKSFFNLKVIHEHGKILKQAFLGSN